jgi:hypothetical protein
MEAWLMNVPTLMINPDPNFTRVDFYHGSASVKSKTEIENVFNQFFIENDNSYFFQHEVLKKRNDIIENSIGFEDGLNHLRIIKAFQPFLDKSKKPEYVKPNWRFMRLYLLLHLGKYFYNKSIYEKLPKFKKTIWIFENYKLEKLKIGKTKVYQDLDKFYNSIQLHSKSDVKSFTSKL